MNRLRECPGSRQVQMLSWLPDKSGYPGAVICPDCSFGVPVLKRSVHKAISEGGYVGLAGTARVHYVSADGETMSLRMQK